MVKEEWKDDFRDLWRETIRAMVLGWDLALPIFMGVLAGYFLDKWLGTVYIFTIGLLVAGIGIGYYNVGRFIQRLDSIAKKREEEAMNSSTNDEKTKGERASDDK